MCDVERYKSLTCPNCQYPIMAPNTIYRPGARIVDEPLSWWIVLVAVVSGLAMGLVI